MPFDLASMSPIEQFAAMTTVMALAGCALYAIFRGRGGA